MFEYRFYLVTAHVSLRTSYFYYMDGDQKIYNC